MRKPLFTVLITFVVFFGCSSPKEYVFQPLDNTSLTFELHRTKYRPNTTSVFSKELKGLKIRDIQSFSLESSGLEGPP